MGYKLWDEEEIELLYIWIKDGWSCKEIANELDRTFNSVSHKLSNLKLRTGKNMGIKSHEQYVKELKEKCQTIIVLGKYINDKTKIVHKCLVCGTEYLCTPKTKLKGYGHCRYINNGKNIDIDKPGITYLVYFTDIDLYKIGITSRTTKIRNDKHGYKYEIILDRYFEKGLDAIKLEKEWLANISAYKINTKLLSNGNTETFKY
jgi:hypothetical protein